MKTKIKKLDYKNLIIGFVLGISLVSGGVFASNGTIGDLFQKIGGNWFLIGSNIANGTVSTEKIAAGAINNSKLANNSVSSSKIADNAVINSKIANNAVSTVKIAAGAVNGSRLANGSVSTSKMVSNSVTPTILQSNGIFTMGGLTVGGTIRANSFLYTSDERFKENINEIDNSLEIISNLRGVEWDWKSNGQKDMGFIAQEVEEILPYLVATDEEGFKSVKYGNMVGLLLEGIKELKEQNEELSKRLDALEK